MTMYYTSEALSGRSIRSRLINFAGTNSYETRDVISFDLLQNNKFESREYGGK